MIRNKFWNFWNLYLSKSRLKEPESSAWKALHKTFHNKALNLVSYNEDETKYVNSLKPKICGIF